MNIHDMISGYWIALAVTLALEGISLMLIINFSDWEKEAQVVSNILHIRDTFPVIGLSH